MRIEVKKDNPPVNSSRGGRGVWKDRLTKPMEEPGEWFSVAFGTKGSVWAAAHGLRSGKYKIPEGDWQFYTGKVSDQEYGLWAKYQPTTN